MDRTATKSGSYFLRTPEPKTLTPGLLLFEGDIEYTFLDTPYLHILASTIHMLFLLYEPEGELVTPIEIFFDQIGKMEIK